MSDDSSITNVDTNSIGKQSAIKPQSMSRGAQTAWIVGGISGILIVLFAIFMQWSITNNPSDPYVKCRSIFGDDKECKWEGSADHLRRL